MDGIEILAQKTVQTPLVVPIWFTFLAVLAITAFVLQSFITARETDKKFKKKQRVKLVLIFVIVLLTVFMSVYHWADRGAYDEYTVLIEDTVSFNDFNDMYEMVSHDGSGLYVVKELSD